MIVHNQNQTERSAFCFPLPTVAPLASAAAVGRCARVNLEMKKPHHLRWIMIQTRDREEEGGMEPCKLIGAVSGAAPAGAAGHVKNAAAWWGSAAVWRLILMDPVLLSKVPLAPVSVRALWVTCAATETGTDPLHCLYSTKKVWNLKTRWCDASFVCARWYQSYTNLAEIPYGFKKNEL